LLNFGLCLLISSWRLKKAFYATDEAIYKKSLFGTNIMLNEELAQKTVAVSPQYFPFPLLSALHEKKI
jgi:hypothetical protein